jgi:hypothetical protein
MRVDPEYNAVGKFFGREPMFRVPKYQRSYAWGDFEIDDFLKDLEGCFYRRKAGQSINHFFGGIVSVEKKVQGVVRQHEYELVDGQQRIATFVLLVAALLDFYKKLLQQVRAGGDVDNEKIIQNRIDRLSVRFIEFEQEVNRQTQIVDVLTLSKSDFQFFKDLIRLNYPDPERESHKNLENAYRKIVGMIDRLTRDPSLSDFLDNLEAVELIIDNDFSLIHIVTHDHREAYKLFQVLNDRGKSLSEGDLLRAKTLEVLEGFVARQTSVESLWDDILKDNPKQTEDYLRWVYASFQGTRAGSNTLFDDFLDRFYPEHQQALIDENAADSILTATRKLQNEIVNARKILAGTWPFQSARPITAWDRNRLTLLIRELGLTVTIPILLAAVHLGEQKFSAIVQILERFLFRYKVITSQHIEAVVSIFHTHSVSIRNSPATYNIEDLKNVLRHLQNSRANDNLFRSTLDNLNYKDGGGNKPIKYFFMTLEHYRRWYLEGHNGEPSCRDKTRVYDFTSTTIEHIYPRNAREQVFNQALEPFKNNIGNLTFMGPTDNVAGGNDDFATKMPLFLNSSVGLNQEIGQKLQWTAVELQEREELVKIMACAIFNI